MALLAGMITSVAIVKVMELFYYFIIRDAIYLCCCHITTHLFTWRNRIWEMIFKIFKNLLAVFGPVPFKYSAFIDSLRQSSMYKIIKSNFLW